MQRRKADLPGISEYLSSIPERSPLAGVVSSGKYFHRVSENAGRRRESFKSFLPHARGFETRAGCAPRHPDRTGEGRERV